MSVLTFLFSWQRIGSISLPLTLAILFQAGQSLGQLVDACYRAYLLARRTCLCCPTGGGWTRLRDAIGDNRLLAVSESYHSPTLLPPQHTQYDLLMTISFNRIRHYRRQQQQRHPKKQRQAKTEKKDPCNNRHRRLRHGSRARRRRCPWRPTKSIPNAPAATSSVSNDRGIYLLCAGGRKTRMGASVWQSDTARIREKINTTHTATTIETSSGLATTRSLRGTEKIGDGKRKLGASCNVSKENSAYGNTVL